VGLVAPITTLPDAASDAAAGSAPDAEPVAEAATPFEAAADSTATPVDDGATLGDAANGIALELDPDSGPCDPLPEPPASDAGSCDPFDDGYEGGCRPGMDVLGGGFTGLSYAPPPPYGAACNAADIDELYDSCISRGLVTAGQCAQAFPDLDPRGACETCVFDSSGTGPFLTDYPDYAYYYVNVAGCVALAEPCNVACAKSIAANTACTSASCSYICQGYAASIAQIGDCQSAAETCPCAQEQSLSGACVDAIQARGSPASFCVGLSSVPQLLQAPPSLSAAQLVTLMTLFCGTL
jgi:hypothetical protein